MNYRHVYMLIIEHAKSEMSNGLRPKNQLDKKNFNDYFELHHVLPKSKFPNWGKRQLNIVALTLREHYFCHLLLTKIYNDRCIQLAYLLMANRLKSLGLKVANVDINRKMLSEVAINDPEAFKGICDVVLTLPMVLPPTVCGYFLLLVFGVRRPLGILLAKLGITFVMTWQGGILASVLVAFPLLYRPESDRIWLFPPLHSF